MAELEDGLLEGEVVLVSGATQGLVAGIAAAAARNDVADVVTGRRQEAGGEVAARISNSAMVGLAKNAAFAHRWDRIRINGPNIGWTETDGEDAIQRRFHDAEEGWQARAAGTLPMGNSDRSTRSRTSSSCSCRRAAAW